MQKYRGKGFDPLEIRAHRAFLQAFNGQCPNSQHIYPMGLSKSTQLSRPLCLWQHSFLAHPFSQAFERRFIYLGVHILSHFCPPLTGLLPRDFCKAPSTLFRRNNTDMMMDISIANIIIMSLIIADDTCCYS